MEKSLVSLLQIEGVAKDKADLDGHLATAGLLTYAVQSGYYQAMATVVVVYKPAAAMRVVRGGVNTSTESVERFRACSDRLLAILEAETAVTSEPTIVKALIMHNAASSLAVGNGNKPEDQAVLNESALTTLHALWGGEEYVRESADWDSVYCKVAVGLYEQGASSFDVIAYRGLISTMERIGSKDAAGRRLFLAKWFMSQGHIEDAIMSVRPVMGDDYISAPNQIADARAYFVQLMQSRP